MLPRNLSFHHYLVVSTKQPSLAKTLGAKMYQNNSIEFKPGFQWTEHVQHQLPSRKSSDLGNTNLANVRGFADVSIAIVSAIWSDK